jgi:glucosamine--fructose-6-phosphate aminotransferase (isomerizing)
MASMQAAGKGSATSIEIASQPAAWRSTLETWTTALGRLPLAADYSDLVFTGCGSSFYLSRALAWVARQRAGVRALAVPASEIMQDADTVLGDSEKLVIAISRSAETSETVAAAKMAGAAGLPVLAITCYPERPLTDHARWTLATVAGQEESIVQTRSFTSMLVAGLAWLEGPASDDMSTRLPAAAEDLMRSGEGVVRELADQGRYSRFYFLGSGARYGLACEGALKMLEMALVEAAAYHPLELRHGPISRVDEHALVIALINPLAWEAEQSVLSDSAELGAGTLALLPAQLEQAATAIGRRVLLGRDLRAPWQLPLYLPLLHSLAFRYAIDQGLDPDAPRHLESVVRISQAAEEGQRLEDRTWQE